MATFPALNYLSNAARTEGEIKTALEDLLAAAKQIPGAAIAETELTLSADAVTPPGGLGVHSIDTEADAASDDLKNIAQTNIPDGGFLFIHSNNSARKVVVKHAAGGAGQILLKRGVDFELDDTGKWLLLKRTGTNWEEIAHFSLSDDRMPVLAKTAAYTATLGDNGKVIDCTSGTFTLTLPAAASAGSGYVLGVRNTGTGVITIDANAAETIDGALTIKLTAKYDSVLLVLDGTGWHRLSSFEISSDRMPVLAKTAAYTLTEADRGRLIDATSGTWTLTLMAAAVAGDGFMFAVKTGSGTITIDPDGAEQIDGATTLVLGPNTFAFVICNGSAWRTSFISSLQAATYTDVTASRVIGTVYQNTSGKLRQLLIRAAQSTDGVADSQVTSDSAAAPTTIRSAFYDSVSTAGVRRNYTHNVFVPNNHYYKLTNPGATWVIDAWYEMDL